MKKWKKVLIIILCIIAALAAAGISVYKLYVEPKIVDPALLKVQEALNNENVQQSVDSFVNEMLESGVLQESDIQEYIDLRAVQEIENAVKEHNDAEAAAQAKPTSKPTATPKKKMTLIERAKAEMTADEFAFAMSVYSRVDVNFILSNIGTNRKAVKEHAKSRLSGAEISRALKIYSKYSYILRE